MISTKSTIKHRLLIRILLVSSFITLILSAFQLFRDYSIDTNFIDTRLEQIERTRLSSIKENLWTFNQDVLKIELENLNQTQDISYVAIRTPNGVLIEEFGDNDKGNYKTLVTPIIYLFKDEEHYLGDLIVKATLDGVYQRLKDKVIIIVITQMLKTFLVSAFILLFIYQIVTNPLNRLTRYVKGLSVKVTEHKIKELKSGFVGNDELSTLSNAFTDLHLKLMNQYHELELSEKNFKQIFDYSNDAIMVIDVDTSIIIEVNGRASDLLGYSISELKGMSAMNIHPDEMTELQLFFKDVLEGGSSFTSNLKCLTNSGEKVPSEISASIITFNGKIALLALIRDIRKQRKAELKMEYMAYHDALTQLPNRSLFNDRLEHLMARAIRHKTHGGLIFFDLDKFKNINDSLGHSVGDELLVQIAERIRHFLRDEETVARLSGDEFVFLLADDHEDYLSASEHTMEIAHKLHSVVGDPYLINGESLNITFSAGIVIYPDNGKTVDDLIRRADSAMYQAKNNGRSISVIYQSEIDEKLQHKLKLQNELKNALINNEFYLVYQAKLDPKLGKVMGAEVLLRWNNECLGDISPVEFIPLLESSGDIVEVGLWVLQQACAQWQNGIKCGDIETNAVLAVNASPRQFQEKSLVEDVQEIINQTGINPALLEIEITEESMLKNYEDAAQQMKALKTIGLTIALDDFGTGYSSLSYLHNLPVDTLKIDRSFVMQVPNEKRVSIMMSAVIGMAHQLQLKVVAEGVETKSQQDFLIANHCDQVQGFYYSKPVIWQEFIAVQSKVFLQG